MERTRVIACGVVGGALALIASVVGLLTGGGVAAALIRPYGSLTALSFEDGSSESSGGGDLIATTLATKQCPRLWPQTVCRLPPE